MSEITTLRAELVISEDAIQKILETDPIRHTTAEGHPIKTTEQQHIAVATPNIVTTAETEPYRVTTTEPQHVTASEPHYVTAVEGPHATVTETKHVTVTETKHVTVTAETQHATVAETKPIVTLGTEHFAVTESKIDFASVLLHHAAQAAGFINGFEVITRKPTVCDMVFTDDQGRKLTTYVKQENDEPVVVVDMEGFKGTKECTKKTDAIIKYLTEHGVKVRAKRSVHNKPEGVLRQMINKQKAKKNKQKASEEAVRNYLTGDPNAQSTRQQQHQ